MFFPSEAQRYAAQVHHEYERLLADFDRLAGGRPAPSLEVLIEEARRDPRRDVLTVIMRKRVTLKP
jgi:hypothetical protein